jgi:hypothetical protein
VFDRLAVRSQTWSPSVLTEASLVAFSLHRQTPENSEEIYGYSLPDPYLLSADDLSI